ncbi:GTP cyclohydrolase [Acrasis kona]|uniref:GTP cyclohydrolase n=1 Tax=Acrasis kona TaxID=1008807 RepID=A0AAW2ZQD0_9EUKA
MKEVINFYNQKDAYGCFSNFSAHSFELEDKHWMTSEHYFQAKKFEGTQFEEDIRNAETPGISAKMGRSRWFPLRADWEHVKEDFMYRAIHAKFTQNDDIRKILLGTGNAKLVEHTRNDSYWGDGGNGHGQNRLGVLLMKLRDELEDVQF